MRPFLIWFQHRSGSTHLVSLLNSHPQIKCKGEIFGCFRVGRADQKSEFPECRLLGDNLYRRVLNQFPGRIENPNDELCIKELNQFLFTGDKRVRGFKFKFPSQSSLFPEISDLLIQKSNEISMLVLTRKNLLRRAISVMNLEWVQSQTNQANLKIEAAIAPIEYDVRELIRLIDYYQKIDDEFSRWSQEFSFCKKLDYYELTTKTDETCSELQEFLGVQHEALQSKTKKITPTDLRKQVLNFDELKEALENHDYSHYLND